MSTPMDGYVSSFETLRPALPGARIAWLREARQVALERFSKVGFPTPRDESWKYTNVAPITRQIFAPAQSSAAELSPVQVQGCALPGLAGPRLVFVDGFYSREHSEVGGLPKGAALMSLATALESDPATLEAHLRADTVAEPHGFLSLNTAFMADGFYLNLAPGACIEEPIQVLFIATGGEVPLMLHPRNLIVAGEGSSATVIERYVGLGEGRYLTNAATEMALAPGAQVQHYTWNEEGGRGFHVGGLYLEQAADSRCTAYSLAMGGALLRNDLHVALRAPGAYSDLKGLYVLGGRQHVDNQLRVEHLAGGCTSRQHYRGVLDDGSRAVFSARVVVHPQAQHSDAQQVNKNLLLSGDAEVDTRPQLEIYADDVKCAHGATVGQLDPNSLFYLRSRGLDEQAARQALIHAFVGEIVDGIAQPAVRQQLEHALSLRLSRSPDAA